MTVTPDSVSLIPLPWHLGAARLLEEVRAGRESALWVGPKGVGKSEFAKRHASSTVGEPRRIAYVSVGEVKSGAGVLAAVLDAIYRDATSVSTVLHATTDRARRRGASYLLGVCAEEAAVRDIGAVVLDELPFLAAPALQHVTQLLDHCAYRYQHRLGLGFISTSDDHPALHESGELGQRISTVQRVPPLSASDVEAAVRVLSPAVTRVLSKLGDRARATQLTAVVHSVDGSIRRLTQILRRAEQIATARDRHLSLEDLTDALDAQAVSL